MCAYNEIGRIHLAMQDLFESMNGHSEQVEVLVIDNGSADGTVEWLRNLRHPSLKVEFNERNLGKGGSIKKGIRLSRGRYVVIHDPDFEYRAKDIWTLLEVARRKGASLVLGSRVIDGEVRYKYLKNYLGVIFLSKLISWLFGSRISDAATAMKMFDGDMLRALRLDCNGFDLDFELVTRVIRLGGKVEEARADYYPRTMSEGKKIRAWADGCKALHAILRDRFLPRSCFLDGAYVRAKEREFSS